MTDSELRLYRELADWYHLLTQPEEYADEATFFLRVFAEELGRPPVSLLELGSGGGCMATHFPAEMQVTLTDIAPEMLAISLAVNPGREHIQGDMRTLRLGRRYDAVLVHDAICYLLTEADLLAAMTTAFAHLRPGGAAIFAPDYVRETFTQRTDSGGYDRAGRTLRYLEYCRDPDPTDTTYRVDYVYLLLEDGEPPRVEHDVHIEGLFSRASWLTLLQRAGFSARVCAHGAVEEEFGELPVFVARRPDAGTGEN